jgi:Domain of unknown function (DUF1835)
VADQLGSYPQFRLNLEQQRKRAKELLKAARSGIPAARARFQSLPQLAEAQHLIAQELRFNNWTSLKRHIVAMTRERDSRSVLDSDLRTLHIRCGSDLAEPLQRAGFHGDFYEHNYPYLIGPVREGPGCLEQRARFIVDAYSDSRDAPRQLESELLGLQRAEQLLHDSAEYDRVVVWSEFDCYDQLALVRLLGHYSMQPRPAQLELINVGEFPGAIRFIGLGQLPPEALRLLWATRRAATAAMLNLGLQTWRALVDPDPRALAAIMRGGTPALPLLAKALQRHLRELPSNRNGLSLTEEMSLQQLAEAETTLIRLIGRQVYELDPLPGQGDSNVRFRLLHMEEASARVFERHPDIEFDGQPRSPWTDRLTITDLGRAVLAGEVDFLSLQPPNRWVGGVEIGHGLPDWRWNERVKDATLAR